MFECQGHAFTSGLTFTKQQQKKNKQKTTKKKQKNSSAFTTGPQEAPMRAEPPLS